jgi:mitogen-activated protein kinase 1/3
MVFVTDDKAKEYLKSFSIQEKANLANKFPKVPKEAIDFLERAIRFDPRKRITVNEALEHPFFKSIRDPTKEQGGETIKMSFENEG